MRHLMLDIETMATHTSKALILSGATLPFDLRREGPVFGQGMLFVLDAGPQLLTRVVSKKTQRWWAEQTSAARAHWEKPTTTIGAAHLRSALYDLILKIGKPDEVEVWANGDRFDLGNLENVMAEFSPELEFDDVIPWKYNRVSDCRTLYRWSPKLREMPQDLKFESHDPMEDCKKQVWRLWEVASDMLLMPEGGVVAPAPGPLVGEKIFPSVITTVHIPPNVTWSEEHSNFYDAITHVGKGEQFYNDWKERRHEFPPTPKIAIHSPLQAPAA